MDQVAQRFRDSKQAGSSHGTGPSSYATVIVQDLPGHGRGVPVAYPAALDQPGRITHVAVLDVVPASEVWEQVDDVHSQSVAGGHFVPEERPQETAARIRDFLTSLPE